MFGRRPPLGKEGGHRSSDASWLALARAKTLSRELRRVAGPPAKLTPHSDAELRVTPRPVSKQRYAKHQREDHSSIRRANVVPLPPARPGRWPALRRSIR